MSIEEKLTPLIANPTSWDLFTQEEPKKRIPLAEQKCNNCYRGTGVTKVVATITLMKKCSKNPL